MHATPLRVCARALSRVTEGAGNPSSSPAVTPAGTFLGHMEGANVGETQKQEYVESGRGTLMEITIDREGGKDGLLVRTLKAAW